LNFLLDDSDEPLANACPVTFEMMHSISGNVLSLASVIICLKNI
jgi:hypothetical protein